VRFHVTALWLVTATVALAAAGVLALVVSRGLAVDESERSSLGALGWTARDLMAERAMEGGLVAAVAVPVAVAVGWAVTALFPLGALALVEPHGGPRLDGPVTVVGVIGLVALAVTVGAVTGGRRRSPARAPGAHIGAVARAIAESGASMPLATGARLATPLGRRRPLRSLVAGALGVAGIVAAAVVGLSLAALGDQPARWGVNYDQFFGNPYVAADGDIVGPAAAEPDIEAVSGANLGALTLDGHDVATFAVETVKGDIRPVVLRGRPPIGDDEIGLGAEIARRLDVDIGDEVTAAGPGGKDVPLRVVGISVTPDSAGAGAAMTFAGYVALNPAATRNLLLVRFRDGAPPDVAARLAEANYSPPGLLIEPTSVRALERVGAAPFLLAAVLTVLLVVSWAYVVAMIVRSRRHDLAVMRALGCRRRQLRAIVHWYATTTALVVLAAGIPLGVIAGRRIVSLLTETLGIVPGEEVPPGMLVAGALVVVLVANVLALSPGRRAARKGLGTLLSDRRPT